MKKYSKGNFFSLYSQQMGRVSVVFSSTLWDWILQGFFQTVLFFGPKGILNQATTPGFTASFPFLPTPTCSSSSFWIMLNLFGEASEKELCLVWGFLWGFLPHPFSESVKEVLASLLTSTGETYIKITQNGKHETCWCWWQSCLIEKLRLVKQLSRMAVIFITLTVRYNLNFQCERTYSS